MGNQATVVTGVESVECDGVTFPVRTGRVIFSGSDMSGERNVVQRRFRVLDASDAGLYRPFFETDADEGRVSVALFSKAQECDIFGKPVNGDDIEVVLILPSRLVEAIARRSLLASGSA
ncbi:MAG: hypothetical protein ABL984_12010 [Pyrinomonadaceae bacterium]